MSHAADANSCFDPPVRTPGRRYFLAKRGVDLVLATFGLTLAAPLLLTCMAWVLICDGRPVHYAQWRVGLDGRMFRILKLRTMRRAAERDGRARFARRADPRVIPGCEWMRRSHVDELPQLWNILRGEMSVVGPRPERPEVFEQLETSLPEFDRRLAAPPGLTGLAQVRQGYANDLAGLKEKLRLDLEYLRRRSVWAELKLILATFPKLWDSLAV